MASVYENALTRLNALIEAQFPDLSVIARVTQLSRHNWRELRSAGTLTVPFGIVQTTALNANPLYGRRNRVWDLIVAFHFVRDRAPTSAETAAEALVEDSLVEQALALATAIYANNEPSTFQCELPPSIDASEESPANVTFFNLGADLYAVSVTATLIIGETDESVSP